MTVSATARSAYRPEIDGLRAIAVIAVIINHISKDALPSGHLGVDIFFVISGFVITRSLLNRNEPGLGSFLAAFYARRFQRILPALLLCVLLTSLAICAVAPYPGTSLTTGIAALLGVSNLYLYANSTDYFSLSADLNAFLQTWSLGVEEQFYVLFPLVFWACGIHRNKRVGVPLLAATIAALCVLSFAGFLHTYTSNSNASFFLSPWRFWELGAGVLLSCADHLLRGRAAIPAVPRIGPWILLGAMAFTLRSASEQSMQTTPVIVALTALLIASLNQNQTSLAWRFLTLKPLRWVGLISYSLYLWHWSVLALSRWTVGIHAWTIPFQTGLMLLLAVASYRWVETPCRRARWSESDGGTLKVGMAMNGLALSLVAGLGLTPDQWLYTGRKEVSKRQHQPSLQSPYQVPGLDAKGWPAGPCLLTTNAERNQSISLEECRLDAFPGRPRTVLVIGNSYAASLISAFDEIIRRDRTSVALTASWGASPVPEIPNSSPWSQANAAYWNRVVPQLLHQLKPGDTLLIISDLHELSPKQQDPSSQTKLAQLRSGLERLSRQTASKGVQLAILSATPLTREAKCLPGISTSEWFNAFGGPCQFLSKAETIRRTQPTRDLLAGLNRSHGVVVVDILDKVCPGAVCSYQTQEVNPLYRDGNSHFSIEAGRLVAPLVRETLAGSPGTTP